MITYCYAVWNEFMNFIGGRNGLLHWLLFCAALLFCVLLGKGDRKRLFWPSVLVLLFFFNPLFYATIGTKFLSGVYWRLLWMLPVSFVIAYALTRLVYRQNKDAVRIAVIVIACVCIIVTGEREFSAKTYREKENEYEIAQAAVEISDIVAQNLLSWKENIIVPNELLCDVRQYSSAVGLLYGRNAGGFISDIAPDEQMVYEEMSKEEPDLSLVTEVARARECRYIVFNTSFHRIPEDLTGYGYEKIAVVQEDYAVYRRMVQQ